MVLAPLFTEDSTVPVPFPPEGMAVRAGKGTSWKDLDKWKAHQKHLNEVAAGFPVVAQFAKQGEEDKLAVGRGTGQGTPQLKRPALSYAKSFNSFDVAEMKPDL